MSDWDAAHRAGLSAREAADAGWAEKARADEAKFKKSGRPSRPQAALKITQKGQKWFDGFIEMHDPFDLIILDTRTGDVRCLHQIKIAKGQRA